MKDLRLQTRAPGKAPTRACRALDRISSPALLIALMLCYLLVVFVLFPAMASEAARGTGPLDLLFHYSPDRAYAMIEAYGPQGRSAYRLSALTADVVYPVVYSLMFSVWLTLLLRPRAPGRCLLQILPFTVLIADLLENSGIVAMLTLYPARHDGLAMATSLMTSVKWSLAALMIGATVVFTLRAAASRLATRRRNY